MSSPRTFVPAVFGTLALLAGVAPRADEPPPVPPGQEAPMRWLAGDHHVHSRFSVGWDRAQEPPAPQVGGDAIYPIPMNALMARLHGLTWMASTDHGGPNHSRVNRERAYPELLLSRKAVPEVLQFYAMELNSPGADHSSVIIPHHAGEAAQLFEIESRYDRLEAWPLDPARREEALMLEALRFMADMDPRPVVIANHPSRASEAADGRYDPAELRRWNDTAPEVAVGMEGAPGHQAMTLAPDGSVRDDADRPRGAYATLPTMGGFDPMTARVGGLWDALLREGRRWWITANSDSHVHYTEGGGDFWPGEYSKTYVFAHPTHDSILEGLRAGRVFVVTGDLIDQLDVEVRAGDQVAGMGEELTIESGTDVIVSIRYRDPATPNFHGDNPRVSSVDLIVGAMFPGTVRPNVDRTQLTRVMARFGRGPRGDAREDEEAEVVEVTHRLRSVGQSLYVRVRGTNTGQLSPQPDTPDEDPWSDLWFYSNPVFVRLVEPAASVGNGAGD